jgi:putative endonuclease
MPAKRSAERASSRELNAAPSWLQLPDQGAYARVADLFSRRKCMPVFREKLPCVYILVSRKEGTLYTGVTSDLLGRLHSHKQGEVPGFTKRYGVDRLVYFELHPTMGLAITREKQIKKWYRAWKIDLIESANPEWRDLSPMVFDGSAFERLRR